MAVIELTMRKAFYSLLTKFSPFFRLSGCGKFPEARGTFWGAMLVAALLAGCAGVGGLKPDSPEEQKRKVVGERAEARWQALIKGDLEAAYGYMSPSSRAALPLDVYKAKLKPGSWRSAKTKSVNCEGELCKVVVNVTFDTRLIQGLAIDINENWVISDGTAWIILK